MKWTLQEEFLQYIWRKRLFDYVDLKSTRSESVKVLSFGRFNTNAGPDFLDAKVQVGGVLWIGHIEIHIKSSDWYNHRHHLDVMYENVVLHVVVDHDKEVMRNDGTYLPCINIFRRISKSSLKSYYSLKSSLGWVPCENMITSVSEETSQKMYDKMLFDRLLRKSKETLSTLKDYNYDLSKLVYHKLAWSFGLSVNAQAFLQLAESLPLRIIQKESGSIIRVESLLFGQSGLLPKNSTDPYVIKLNKEYSVLQRKYSLTSLKSLLWKFSRLRPSGFPTIRIAQFATLLSRSEIVKDILSISDRNEIIEHLSVGTSEYWEYHYRFGTVSKRRIKSLGVQKINSIIINVLAPILFAYSLIYDTDEPKDKALRFLYKTPPDHNAIVKKWRTLNFTPTNAAQSQALISLKNNYCDQGQCLDCPIGHQLLN